MEGTASEDVGPQLETLDPLIGDVPCRPRALSSTVDKAITKEGEIVCPGVRQ